MLGSYTPSVPEPVRATTPPWQRWLTFAARLILGGVLLAAGLLKVGALQSSVDAVRAYQIVPWDVAEVVGVALPIIEIIVGVLLIVGAFTRWASLVGALLMLAFIIGISSVWARGINIDCGCFGGGGQVDPSQTNYVWELLRDTGLLVLGAWAVWRPSSPLSVDAWLFPARVEDTAQLEGTAQLQDTSADDAQ